MDFKNEIFLWYHAKKRLLPWRETSNAYHIWVSEVILQQTRIAQGLAYFQRFIATFPDVQALAEADEQEVLKLWQGLGYYSRARNMHFTAKQIVSHFNGVFPSSYNELLKLKGIGEYTASAIASFAFKLPHPAVDGNVFRFISRLFGVYEPINTSKGKNSFQTILLELIDRERPDIFNQAIIEFGAIQCVVQNPKCEECIFRSDCFAYINKCINELPVKSKKIQVKERFFNYLFITENNNTYINKRIGNGIWKNLFELPLIETERLMNMEDIIVLPDFVNLFKESQIKIDAVSELVTHQLTHQRIYARFISISILESKHSLNEHYKCIEKDSLDEYPIPKLIENFLQERK